MSGEDLVKWLDEQREAAMAGAGDELVGAAAPDAETLEKLIKRLADADASLREMAIRRLSPHANVSAAAVAETTEPSPATSPSSI